MVGAAVFWHKTMYHFKTVVSGKVYRSGTMSNIGLKIAHEIYGIKTIVNLRSQGEMKRDWYAREKKFAESNQINMVDIPMLPDTPPDATQTEKFLSIVNNQDMLPVLIHCQAGIIRTGMMVSVYRIGVLKEANAKVMAEMPWFGRTFENRQAVKKFILGYSP
ncbi:MAG: tyrosine-protein phosphatase [Desulfoferrobacter sp.]